MAARPARPRGPGEAGRHPGALASSRPGRGSRSRGGGAHRARQHHRGPRRPRRPRRVLGGGLPAAAAAGRRAGPPAHPAQRVAPRPGRRGRPDPRAGDRAGQRPRVSPAGARAHLDALHRVAAEFTELAELPSLPAFLGYLRDAEERERGLEPGEVAVNPEAVQLLTGHSSKGLEWDVVAVPGMTKDQFPAKADTADSWIKDPGAVPAELRLTDREELPAAAAARPGVRRPGGGEAALERLRPGLEGLRGRRGDPPRLRRGHARPAPAALLGQPVARREDGVRPVVPAGHRAGRLRGRGGRDRAVGRGAGGRRHQPGAGGVAGRQVAGRPADLRTAARADRRRGAGGRRGAAPAGPRAGARRRRPPARAVGTRRRPAAARTRAGGQPDRRRAAALAPVGLGAGHPAPRPGRAGPTAAAADARRARTAGPSGHRLPRLAGGALRRRAAGRPRRAARLRRRVRRPGRCADRAAGGVPGQRVGRPAAGRGRGAVRDAAGAADAARPDRRGVRAPPTAATRSSTGRPARRRRAPSWPPPGCSWPPTGWAGRG